MTGDSSRVATTVAIELAASCKPFRKSNSSARTISAISSGRASSCTVARRSGVVDHDAVDLVGDVFERIDDALQVLVDLAFDHEPQRVAAAVVLERLAKPVRVDRVGMAFDA